jgi:hypothetical protein
VVKGSFLNGWTELANGVFAWYQDSGAAAIESPSRTTVAAAEGNTALRMFVWNNSSSWNGIRSSAVLSLVSGNTYTMSFQVSSDAWRPVYDRLLVELHGASTNAVYGAQTYYFVPTSTPDGVATTIISPGQWTTLTYEFTYTGPTQLGSVEFRGYRQANSCSLYIDAISAVPEPMTMLLLAASGLGLLRRRTA